jgi:hypothetical protein
VLDARLELSTDPSQLSPLKAALERASPAPGGESSLITSIYYDTPDLKLLPTRPQPSRRAARHASRPDLDAPRLSHGQRPMAGHHHERRT